ncbi:hypothetical protein DRN86_04910 [Candidatus Geothermarchaeota archaeon]|nr:MAG: hypothetical protein DRN86_04910 [Candidatus Geothermarchaeota archaeon]
MPIVKTLSDRVQKYIAKTPADQTGTRYGAVKTLAVNRFIEGAGIMAAVRERVRDILEREGVPAADHGVYYAFAFKLASKALSHAGPELDAIAAGLKSWFVAKGADPAILDKIASLIVG